MSQFTKTLEPSLPKNYEQTESGRLISSPVAFPVRMYHAPALEKALKTAMEKLLGQGCGENTQESLANLDQNGLWQKMCEGCCQQVLISDREETSEPFSGTWPTWGIMLLSYATEPKQSAHHINENGYSLLQGGYVRNDNKIKTSTDKILRDVRYSDGTTHSPKWDRGQMCIYKKTILLSRMCKQKLNKRKTAKERAHNEIQEVQKRTMRDMWGNEEFGNPPQGQEQIQQQYGKLNDAMCKLSCETTLCGGQKETTSLQNLRETKPQRRTVFKTFKAVSEIWKSFTDKSEGNGSIPNSDGKRLTVAVYKMKPLARPTKGKESLLWPTARANKIGGSTSEGYVLCLDESVNLADTVKMLRTPDANLGARGPKSAEMYEECKRTNKHALNLLDQVKHECNWPTPTVSDIFTGNLKSSQQKPGSMHSVNLSQCVNWPTPRAREGNAGQVGSKGAKHNAAKGFLDGVALEREEKKISGLCCVRCGKPCENHVSEALAKIQEIWRPNANKKECEGKICNSTGGSLSACWTEILMGLPIGWTDAEISNGELKQWPGWPAPMNANRQWATPNCMDMLPSRSYEAMKHQATNGARKNRTAPGNLREQIDPLMRKAYVEASKENGGKLNEEVSISGQYSYEPPRVIEGQKNRAKRLKCLGNGCCPLQVYPIFKIIMEVNEGRS